MTEEQNPGRRLPVANGSVDVPPRRVHAWLAPGQDWIVEVGGVEIVVRLVERRGRRVRLAARAKNEPIPAPSPPPGK